MKKRILNYLNTPVTPKVFIFYMVGMLVSTFSLLFLTSGLKMFILFLFFGEIIIARKRLVDAGWSPWLSLVYLIQLIPLTLGPGDELAETGQLLFYVILPGFTILLCFIPTNDLVKDYTRNEAI